MKFSILRGCLSFCYVVLILSERATLSGQSLGGYYKKEEKKDDEMFSPIKIMCEINGFSVPAILDTGAEISIMSASCAKRCHLFNQIDRRYSGKALGVGCGEIIGRLDDMMMRMGPISFKSRISILGNSHVDFLIGLDFLKRFKADISLRENVLRLQVKEKSIRIPFFSGYSSTKSQNADDEVRSIEESYEDSLRIKDSFTEPTYQNLADSHQKNIKLCFNQFQSNNKDNDVKEDEYFDEDNEESTVYFDDVSMEGV